MATAVTTKNAATNLNSRASIHMSVLTYGPRGQFTAAKVSNGWVVTARRLVDHPQGLGRLSLPSMRVGLQVVLEIVSHDADLGSSHHRVIRHTSRRSGPRNTWSW